MLKTKEENTAKHFELCSEIERFEVVDCTLVDLTSIDQKKLGFNKNFLTCDQIEEDIRLGCLHQPLPCNFEELILKIKTEDYTVRTLKRHFRNAKTDFRELKIESKELKNEIKDRNSTLSNNDINLKALELKKKHFRYMENLKDIQVALIEAIQHLDKNQ